MYIKQDTETFCFMILITILLFKFQFNLNFRYQLSVTGNEGIKEIRWLYPIQGIPESKPIKDSQGAVVECKARDRLEERLEVTLSGVAPSSSGPHKSVLTRSITPKGSSTNISDGIVVGESKRHCLKSS